MRREWRRFDPRGVDAMLRGLGLATIACVAVDAWAGAWRVHGGELFPWRHLPVFPLYGRAMLVVEWLVAIAGGALLALFARDRRATRLGLGLAIVATLLGLSQRFSNHRALLLIALAFVALDPPDVRAPDFPVRDRPNLALVRAQLGLVYVFSAAHKLAEGFCSGAALVALFGWPAPFARAASWGVLAAELAIPIALALAPRIGIVLVVALHAAMAWLLPTVSPFSLTMIAMSLSFLRPRVE